MEAAAVRYAEFPRHLRGRLHTAIIEDDNSPFHDGPDDSPAGRWFSIAIGDYPAPVAQLPLNEIIRQLPLTNYEKSELANIFVAHMITLQNQAQVGGRKRRRNRKSRRSASRKSRRSASRKSRSRSRSRKN